MGNSSQTVAELLREDPRYKYEAYVFVFDALNYGQQVMGLGQPAESEPLDVETDEATEDPEKHVSGQQLCEAVRQFALDQYGYMAKTVLGTWGIHGTGDIGEVVFNLIRIGKMRKTPQDRREDFEDVYDFDEAFRREFQIRPYR